MVDFLIDNPIANSFGFQWNKFPKVQLDSFSQDKRSRERFLFETNWSKRILNGKLVLDAGCGSGRFSEIALNMGSNLIAVDASTAILAAEKNLRKYRDVFFVRANLLNLPFRDNVFDFVYCIGVIQHTSDPLRCIEELCRVLKVGGSISLTFYEKSNWWTPLHSKYLVRPLTKRIPHQILLQLISKTSVVWFPMTNLLFKLPGVLGKIVRFVIPVANYVNYSYSNKASRRAEAILDTFDMLSPEFDSPIRKSDVVHRLQTLGLRITNSSIKGNIQAEKVTPKTT